MESGEDPAAARAQLLDVLGGFLRTKAIAVVARLGVADLVGDAPVPVEQIAERVGADAGALHRVMRLLASVGVFAQTEPGVYVATPMSKQLRDDEPGSIRYLAMQQGFTAYRAANELLRSVQTGEPAADVVFGMPFFDYLASDAAAGDVFDRAMADTARARASAARQYDWSGASVVADIGGGTGALLTSVLQQEAHLRGVVFDLPPVVAKARAALEEAGLSQRCKAIDGDFFADDLPPADAYVLAYILHDWGDEQAADILRNCRRSLAPDGRLLVFEQVLPDGDERSYGKHLDLIMLALLGGKERTETEWRALLREGGFELKGITPGPAGSLLEAAPG